jgi:DNA-directed RNA polymerase specialized sigma24 family protein
MIANTPCPNRLPHHETQPAPKDSSWDMEQAILAQIDVIYPVAVRITHSRRLARELTERAVLAALRNQDSLLDDQHSVKAAMLALMRSMYLTASPQATT